VLIDNVISCEKCRRNLRTHNPKTVYKVYVNVEVGSDEVGPYEATIDPYAVTVIQPFQRARQVDMKVIIGIVFLYPDPCQICEQVLVHITSERCRGFDLVVD
jgi:hypothetical protein